MKRRITLFLFCFLISVFWLPPSGQASCFNPAGNAGDIVYSGGVQSVIYCNGGAWIALAPVGDARTGLVGWWKFDDGSGTSAADSSGNGNAGTLQNSPTWTTGMNNGALTFNGTTQVVSVPDAAPLDLAGSWTVALWANMTTIPTSGSKGRVIYKGGSSSDSNYAIDFDNGGPCGAGVYWRVNISNGATGGSTCYVPPVNTGVWYHVVGVWDASASNLMLYINGILVATQNFAGFTPDAGNGIPLFIGAKDATLDDPVNGTIDDVRVYNRALTAQDIKTLYSSTGPLSGDIQSNLVGWWKFDESTATDAVDSAGNGNTLTSSATDGNTPGTVVTGKINNARSLDNSGSDYLQLGSGGVYASSPSSSMKNLSHLTISQWIKTTSLNSTSQTPFSGQNAYPNKGFALLDNGPYSSYVIFRIMNGTGWDLTIPRASVNDGNWHLLTGTYDGTTEAFYLDGIQQGTRTPPGYTVDNSDDFYIGNVPSGSVAMDDVRVYNRALSQSDVLTLYNMGVTACAGPVGYAGNLMYNSGTYHAMQFCNGSSWIPAGTVPGAGGSGCASPPRNEGDIIYSSANHVMQYCDGTNWQAMGGIVPVGNGLVGWWNFDEGSGTTAADSSGNANTGTLVNSPTWTTRGKINDALTLNGSTQYVSVPGAVLPSNNNFTASLWFNTTSDGVLMCEQSVAVGGTITSTDPFLYVDSTGVLHGGIWGTMGVPSLVSSAAINNGNWHQAVLVVNGTASTQTLYLDGQIVGNFSGTPEGPLSYVNLGTGGTNALWPNTNNSWFYFNGTIDDVRVYNRALSAQEVWQLYNGT